jgi:hypothetical protein
MPHFFDEIDKALGLPVGAQSAYRLINLGGRVLYVDGFRELLTFEDETVICMLKKGILEVVGKSLTIERYEEGFLIIKGKIFETKFKGSLNDNGEVNNQGNALNENGELNNQHSHTSYSKGDINNFGKNNARNKKPIITYNKNGKETFKSKLNGGFRKFLNALRGR